MILTLALVATTLFAGAAIYITVAEHPARDAIDDGAALAHWRASYARAAPMQAGLAILGGALGLWAWTQSGNGCALAGAALIFANVPLTLIAIMPTNKALKSAPSEPRVLLARWGRLHAVRSALGVAATILLVLAAA